ncbi:homoserine kinase [Paenibacillus medicaginis]|uniref:Homoserine kinase n=1 Tax=Paenibacillus medicaginis TaxID=1470560 RepID=A0ABV5C7C2_9BACL
MFDSPVVRVRVPASTANLGPGFDTLGMALNLYAWIEMKQSDETSFHLYGDQLKGIPGDKSNLIYEVAQMVFNEAGVSVPELEISMYSDIPLTRGLGSSASAIVGALAAANALIGSPLSDARLFDMATAIEKHPDNVGASLYGGIITAVWDGVHAQCIRLDPSDHLEALVVIPGFELATSKARGVLPAEFSLQDAVYNISRSSLLVAALAVGDFEVIAEAMKDRIHQPYRAALVPGMAEILEEAPRHGALGSALSGAGPTLLVLVDRREQRRAELERFLKETMQRESVPIRIMWLKPEAQGVKVYTDVESGRSFLDMIKGESVL